MIEFDMRQVERWEVSAIEQELAFGVWCRREGVKIVLLDGDDTVWKTGKVFGGQIDKCLELLAGTGTASREEWRKRFGEADSRSFERFGVNPKRWPRLIDELGEGVLPEKVRKMAKEILVKMYTTPLELTDLAEEGLGFLKKTGVPMGIVTHAGEEWTRRKYEWSRLERFMEWEDVFLVSEDGHKTAKSWQEAMGYFGVAARECLVVGDSPRADMNATTELGTRHCFLMGEGINWAVHQQPMDEEIVRRIETLNDLRWLGREVVISSRG